MRKNRKTKSRGGRASRGKPNHGETKGQIAKIRGPKRWMFLVILLVVIPVVLIALTEGTLRLIDYGYPTSFFIERDEGQTLTDNEDYAFQFYSPASRLRPHPFSIQAQKDDERIRIFVLGESAAQGTPEAAFGFARILERMLRLNFPTNQFEVVNAAMPGINSHIILPIAKDCAQQDPDLFVLYMGNNEVVGLHAPGPDSHGLTGYLSLLRGLQAVKSSRFGQLIAPLTQHKTANRPNREQDMEFFREHRIAADDPRRLQVYDNFRANLTDTVRTTLQSGAKVLLSTLAVNWKDCPPLGSLHKSDLSQDQLQEWEAIYANGVKAEENEEWQTAVDRYQAALALDDHYAELHFRLARCYEALEDPTNAREHYGLALDWDALPFRGDRKTNEIIHEVREEFKNDGLVFIDTESDLSRDPQGQPGLLGNDLFYEHVHFRFDGDYRMAANLLPHVVGALRDRLGRDESFEVRVPSKKVCMAALGLSPFQLAKLKGTIIELTARPPFVDRLEHQERIQKELDNLREQLSEVTGEDIRAVFTTIQKANQAFRDDWNLYYQAGQLHFELGNFNEAAQSMQGAKKRMPYNSQVRLGIGRALMEAREFDEATVEINELLAMRPDFEIAKAALRTIAAKRTQSSQPQPGQ